MTRLYCYVGPADIKARVAGRPAGTRLTSVADLLAWVRGRFVCGVCGAEFPAEWNFWGPQVG